MRPLPRRRSLSPVAKGLLFLNLVAVAMTAWLLYQAWKAEIRDAEDASLASARLLQRAAAETFNKVAVAMDGAAAVLELQQTAGGIDRDQLWPLLDRIGAQIPEVQVLATFDTDGRQVCGTAPAGRCRDIRIADRDYFLSARELVGSSTQLYGPTKSRLDGEQVMVLARTLRARGTFSGVLIALVPVSRLALMLRGAVPGEGAVASLRTLNLRLVVRDPPLPAGADPATVSTALREALARHPQEGTFHTTTVNDGVNRVAAYARLPSWPLYALAGSASRDVLGQWRQAALGAGAFLLLFIGGSVLLVRSAQREEASRLRAQDLYERAPCGYHTLDANGRYVTINATELAWLGAQREDVVGRLTPKDFFSPESAAAFDSNFPKLAFGGSLRDLELDLIGRDGTQRRVLVNAQRLLDENGAFAGSNTVMVDITALHEARTRAAELATRQGLMLDNELTGIAQLKDRQILWANRGLSRLLGYSQDELSGMPMRRLYPDQQTFDRVGTETYPVLQSGRMHRTEVQLLRKDGSAIWVDLGGAPMTDASGEVLIMLADITDRKRAEELRLREAELHAQNIQLVETNRLQRSFLDNMSHELRTPLNGILGFAHLLEMDAGRGHATDLVRYSRQIMSSGEHLLGLIQAQLDFAEAEAGRITLNGGDVRPGQAVQESLDLVRPDAERAGVMLTATLAEQPATVQCDGARLRQILVQLLDNAVKFSRPGGLVQARTGMLDASQWFIDVEDHGIGIAPADHQRIFSKYTQLSSGSTKSYGGLGIGLALARYLARAMQGDITVARSALGEGTVLRVTLPLAGP